MGRTETWATITPWPNYEVSDAGRVCSMARAVRSKWGTTYRVRERMLAASPSSTGYPTVRLYRDGWSAYVAVHVLVLEAFARPRPAGMVARHGPGGRTDNRWPENLCWGTQSENLTVDRDRDGTLPRGEDVRTAKLTAAIVTDARRRYASGESFQRMAAEFGVDRSAMWRAVTHRTWKHV